MKLEKALTAAKGLWMHKNETKFNKTQQSWGISGSVRLYCHCGSEAQHAHLALARHHTMRGAEDTWLSLETEYVMNRLLYVMNCDVLTIYRVFYGSSTKKNIFCYSSAGNYQFFGLCVLECLILKLVFELLS